MASQDPALRAAAPESAVPRPETEKGQLQDCTPQTISASEGEDGAGPSDDELTTLRRVADRVSIAIYLVGAAEVAERFAFRCLTGPLQNYVEHPYNGGRYSETGNRPGALGKGQAAATAIGFIFETWCFLTPLFGAIIADSWLGRFKTIFGGAIVSACGFIILFATSLPASLVAGAGLPGLIVALFVIGLGTGGIKSNVGPLIADQYSGKSRRLKTLKSGERVILDPDITIQSIFNRLINIGSSSMLLATWIELKVGFWATFLIALSFYVAALIVLVLGRNKYVMVPPQGSDIPRAFQAVWIGMKHWDMDKAKPSYLAQHGHSPVPWTDRFVDEIKIALVACRVFPVFWVCIGQTSGNTISLAARTNTYGLPNDFMGGFNPVAIIIMIPVLDHIIYPTLRRFGIHFRPVTRITFGFAALAGAVAFAAGTQAMVYKRPNKEVSFLWVLPIFILSAMSEVFALVSAVEFAYTKAPSTMKSFVSALNLLTGSIGALIGFALSPTSTYTKVLVQFVVLAAIMGLLTPIFYLLFRKYNKEEERMNQLERRAREEPEAPAGASVA
ncbi:POT family protein [Ophiocordyceps sinensis CO18]|uniref:POT family protein n=1 Tax=Ophiocordyceps sinensis (strain Co18 / CGMCC 3.14243) TaxID=911162 RepID=T5AH25_OPHSC|nr:POT family protein [Ophiocordyceps sinensis CO18]